MRSARSRRRSLFVTALLVLGIVVAACSVGGGDDGGEGIFADNEQDAIENAVGNFSENNWATFGYTFTMLRHVPFTEITKENVTQLGRAWQVNFKEEDDTIPNGNESYPLVIDDTIYVSTSFNHIFALNAENGSVKWHFVPSEIGPFKNFGLNVNRGVAYCDSKLFMVTLDMRLLSVNASSGKLVKQVQISDAVKDAKPEFGYYETMAPVCYKGNVLIGSSGADNGVRGFFMAYNTDLTPAWANPYWTVPPEGQDWRANGRFHGGGAVWMPPSIDPETDTAYFTTSNPSPDFFPDLRPGPNPKTNAVIAVDVDTGREKWWRQQLPADEWDYDSVQPSQIIKAEVGGEERKVLSIATKQGVWFLYDAETGEPIHERVQVLNRVEHPKLEKGKPVTISPAAVGGVTWSPASYDPTTNFVINGRIESSAVLIQSRSAEEVDRDRVRGDVDTGVINGFGTPPKGYKGDTGGVTAVDIDSGRVAWKFDTEQAVRGGITTTASGIAFFGGDDGVLRALDTSNGRELWKFQTAGRIASAPVIFMRDGKQFVAIVTGGSPIAGPTEPGLEVFAIGGQKDEADPIERLPVAEAEAAPAPAEGLSRYLTPSQSPKTVGLLINAAEGPAGGGLNFNNASRGAMTVSIPQGYTVNMTFKNFSSQLPHSAMVTTVAGTRASSGQTPVFENSSTPNPQQGVVSGTQYADFTASKAGTYALICAIPGHAAGGQWITFKVVGANANPSISSKGESFELKPSP